jgi:hypothetical protein
VYQLGIRILIVRLEPSFGCAGSPRQVHLRVTRAAQKGAARCLAFHSVRGVDTSFSGAPPTSGFCVRSISGDVTAAAGPARAQLGSFRQLAWDEPLRPIGAIRPSTAYLELGIFGLGSIGIY